MNVSDDSKKMILTLRQPEGYQINTMRQQSCAAMDEFADWRPLRECFRQDSLYQQLTWTWEQPPLNVTVPVQSPIWAVADQTVSAAWPPGHHTWRSLCLQEQLGWRESRCQNPLCASYGLHGFCHPSYLPWSELIRCPEKYGHGHRQEAERPSDYRKIALLEGVKIIVTECGWGTCKPGWSFLVRIAYWTSFASCIIESTSAWVFFPFCTSCWKSASTVYSPRRNGLTWCSLRGNRALTDFSPVQSSRCVFRSTYI